MAFRKDYLEMGKIVSKPSVSTKQPKSLWTDNPINLIAQLSRTMQSGLLSDWHQMVEFANAGHSLYTSLFPSSSVLNGREELILQEPALSNIIQYLTKTAPSNWQLMARAESANLVIYVQSFGNLSQAAAKVCDARRKDACVPPENFLGVTLNLRINEG